jgi:CheY-like chemotaxis protein
MLRGHVRWIRVSSRPAARRGLAQLESVRTVLIADDELPIRTFLSGAFSWDGCGVLEAATGDAALDLMRAEHPTLVLLDQQMPGIDGLTVCQTIKSDPCLAHTVVIMLTANPGDEARARAVGADGHLCKPFQLGQLLELIDRLLVGSQG